MKGAVKVTKAPRGLIETKLGWFERFSGESTFHQSTPTEIHPISNMLYPVLNVYHLNTSKSGLHSLLRSILPNNVNTRWKIIIASLFRARSFHKSNDEWIISVRQANPNHFCFHVLWSISQNIVSGSDNWLSHQLLNYERSSWRFHSYLFCCHSRLATAKILPMDLNFGKDLNLGEAVDNHCGGDDQPPLIYWVTVFTKS